MRKSVRLGLAGVFAVLMLTTIPAFGGAADSVDAFDDAASSREECLRDCRQWIEEYGRGGGRGGKGFSEQLRRMYARCMAECERKFWKEWDREMEIP